MPSVCAGRARRCARCASRSSRRRHARRARTRPRKPTDLTQRTRPVARSSTRTWPYMSCATSLSLPVASEAAITACVARRQMTFPYRIENAAACCRAPWRCSRCRRRRRRETRSGSCSTDQTMRNGGRSRSPGMHARPGRIRAVHRPLQPRLVDAEGEDRQRPEVRASRTRRVSARTDSHEDCTRTRAWSWRRRRRPPARADVRSRRSRRGRAGAGRRRRRPRESGFPGRKLGLGSRGGLPRRWCRSRAAHSRPRCPRGAGSRG